ncbi:hypothetical protein COY61_00795 [bacterium (Candidatus Gribaldobacteria) CG_4_10_14_0_8_um_filter_33_9]|uniref:N-acetyltransferase domain-containing protein n=1 Tax=bacterium (Candidatus Gribaldobacteria) CG_4_10_14_0_8_um_filter_33_9 TaxID=2014266 RepID=A0A2M7RNS5_9BACT|nr:MAG: hypothetical protein COY61_00795 [bacterium (Candidatus Gribaldobacteria) CG_4_10_14_0_8_um_filter_33_9]
MISIKHAIPSIEIATKIAAKGFIQPITEALLRDVVSHLREGIVFSLEEDKCIIGFSIFSIFDDILYLSGIILMPDFQGRSVGGKVIDFIRQKTGTKYLALRTQSVHMWSVGRKICCEWHPMQIADKNIPKDIWVRGIKVGKKIGSIFPTTIGHYNGPLYGTKPLSRDPKLQSWWDSICDFKRGDAIICIGRFK